MIVFFQTILLNIITLRPSLITLEKNQIPEYLSLYGRLNLDFFDMIMGESNEITGNKTCMGEQYTLLHVIFPVMLLLLPIIISKTSFKQPYNDWFEFSPYYLVKVAWIHELYRNYSWPSISSRWECLYLASLAIVLPGGTSPKIIMLRLCVGTKLRPNSQDISKKCGGRTWKECINDR